MVDRFNGLRLYTIIRRHYQDNEICHLRTTRAHRAECLMAWGVEKRNGSLVCRDPISTDVLRNPARFAGGHFCFPQIIQ